MRPTRQPGAGGDCSTLLGIVTGLRDHVGDVGLVFIDGHEDTKVADDPAGAGRRAIEELGGLTWDQHTDLAMALFTTQASCVGAASRSTIPTRIRTGAAPRRSWRSSVT